MNSLLMINQFTTIFLAILAYSSLLALSSSYYYGNPFYAFEQKQDVWIYAPHQGSIPSDAVNLIDFSDLQCHLTLIQIACSRR